jgi:nicotinamide mononucleotide transporter
MEAFAPLLAAPFSLLGSPVTWLELAAFVLALWMVFANMRVQLIAWPLAIVSSLAYMILFAHSRLYGEASLQIVFVIVAAWGWWQWKFGRQADGQTLRVRRIEPRLAVIVIASTCAAWPLLGFALRRFTDTDVPFFDALPTAGSIAGQWLLGKKYIENWAVWLGVNIVSVALFAYKGLWLTVVLYALFAALSIVGWRAWIRLQAS